MRCASCAGNMEYRKDDHGFLCPFCGAFEKLDQDLSEEEIQKLIDDSISQHRKLDHSTAVGRTNQTLTILSSVVGNIFLGLCAMIDLVVGCAMATEPKYTSLAVIAFTQMVLFIAAIIIRCINRTLERVKLAITANILIIAAAVLAVIFAGFGFYIG